MLLYRPLTNSFKKNHIEHYKTQTAKEKILDRDLISRNNPLRSSSAIKQRQNQNFTQTFQHLPLAGILFLFPLCQAPSNLFFPPRITKKTSLELQQDFTLFETS